MWWRRASTDRASEGEIERLPEARKALAKRYIDPDAPLRREGVAGGGEVVAAMRLPRTDGADRQASAADPEHPPPAQPAPVVAESQAGDDQLPIHRWFDDR